MSIKRFESTDQRLDQLADEIGRGFATTEQWWRATLKSAITVGDNLIEAKSLVKHGQWLDWLDEHFPGHRRTAQDYMRLARNASVVAHLPTVKDALAALGEPKEIEPAEPDDEPGDDWERLRAKLPELPMSFGWEEQQQLAYDAIPPAVRKAYRAEHIPALRARKDGDDEPWANFLRWADPMHTVMAKQWVLERERLWADGAGMTLQQFQRRTIDLDDSDRVDFLVDSLRVAAQRHYHVVPERLRTHATPPRAMWLTIVNHAAVRMMEVGGG